MNPQQVRGCLVREEIARLAGQEPGIRLAAAAERLGLHETTVRYHAHRLERDGRLRVLVEARRTRLYRPRPQSKEPS